MKKLLKFGFVGLLVVAVGIFSVIGYVMYFLPNVPVENVKVEITPERVERGKYLANNVSQCVDCHSTRDWSRFSGPIVPGTEGKGGEAFDHGMGFPGKFYAPNITPYNLAGWSDGELFRAITSGVSRDGRALFPIMPYPSFAKMDREDIYSIIAYIRTLAPVEHTAPASVPDFPMNIILRTIPQKPEFTTIPPPTDKLSYGKYLANAASCAECHTPAKSGQIIEEKMFSGGRVFDTPEGLLISPNITPHKETGIGRWTEEAFVERFKAYDPAVSSLELKPGTHNTLMPWANYAGMSREDLGAIYTYLMSVEPIPNKVQQVFIKK